MALKPRLLQGVTTFAHSCGVLVPRHHSQVDFCLEMPRKTTRHKLLRALSHAKTTVLSILVQICLSSLWKNLE